VVIAPNVPAPHFAPPGNLAACLGPRPAKSRREGGSGRLSLGLLLNPAQGMANNSGPGRVSGERARSPQLGHYPNFQSVKSPKFTLKIHRFGRKNALPVKLFSLL